jgi:hypothetical protein
MSRFKFLNKFIADAKFLTKFAKNRLIQENMVENYEYYRTDNMNLWSVTKAKTEKPTTWETESEWVCEEYVTRAIGGGGRMEAALPLDDTARWEKGRNESL